MTPGSAPDPGHESSDARGAKRVRELAPPPLPRREGSNSTSYLNRTPVQA